MCFLPYLGIGCKGGGALSPRGESGTQPSAFHPVELKNGSFCIFFYVVTTHNDHPNLCKTHVFFALFGGSLPKEDSLRGGLAAPGMGLGDHLVTVWVLEHPWEPT